ncbi:hypothetical protein D9611_010847 [Ephemerocybe angulata]|uniref:Uncharacterized protein n=1 Tax=Ephemerocybe angulata TaxID=980116 RepID=A0A8H5C4W5_9AGAR|nr:hypothetical protein D9611_010847 [Tulosesus angulatus]
MSRVNKSQAVNASRDWVGNRRPTTMENRKWPSHTLHLLNDDHKPHTGADDDRTGVDQRKCTTDVRPERTHACGPDDVGSTKCDKSAESGA